MTLIISDDQMNDGIDKVHFKTLFSQYHNYIVAGLTGGVHFGRQYSTMLPTTLASVFDTLMIASTVVVTLSSANLTSESVTNLRAM